MAQPDENFFATRDPSSREKEEEGNATVQPVFQNEKCVFSKDNADYVRNLKKQIEMLDRLKKQQQ